MELNEKLTKCKVSMWGVFIRPKYLCRNFGVKEEEGVCSKGVIFVKDAPMQKMQSMQPNIQAMILTV